MFVNRSLRPLVLILLTLLISVSAFAAAETTPPSGVPADAGVVGEARYFVTITRFGSFLNSPEKEQLELFRRLSRMLVPFFETYLKNAYDIAGFTPLGPEKQFEGLKPVPAAAWTQSQQAAVEKLRSRESELLRTVMNAVPFPDSGLHLVALLDPKTIIGRAEAMIAEPEFQSRLKPRQLANIRNRILPMLQMADAIAVAARLTPAGLNFELHLRAGKNYADLVADNGVFPAPLRCGAYLEPGALLTFAQVHPPASTTATMQMLQSIPQTKIVETYLASAGLEFERDILSNPGVESFAQLDLLPTGEGGLPEFRAAVRVKDPTRLLSLVPNFKQLAMSVGVMATPNLEPRPTVKLSYFLLPALTVHVSMLGDLLLFATSRDSLLRLADRIEQVTAGKLPGFTGVPADAHRFWNIRFGLLNEQLQKFLQSPLLQGRGIPPFTNINVTNELGDLQMVTRIKPDGMTIRLDLPIATGSAK